MKAKRACNQPRAEEFQPSTSLILLLCAASDESQQTVTGKVAEEADDIRICGGISTDGGATRAFINKLDAKLGTLTNCKRLSLSTNCIDKMLPFSGMTQLNILSLGRNNLKRVEKLDDLAGTLEQLWLSYNSISSLDGVLPLAKLKVLYMAHNQIKDWAEIEKLASLAEIREVIFVGNPIYEGMDEDTARANVVKRIPHVSPLECLCASLAGEQSTSWPFESACPVCRCAVDCCPQIVKVDAKLITDEHRELAATL
jgi:dynein light chain 1